MATKKTSKKEVEEIEKVEEVVEAPITKKISEKEVVPKCNIVWAKEKWGLLLKGKTYKVSEKDFNRIKHLVK